MQKLRELYHCYNAYSLRSVEFFFLLPFRLRLLGVLAFLLFGVATGIVMHLAVGMVPMSNGEYQRNLIDVFGLLFFVYTVSTIPLLYPRLKDYYPLFTLLGFVMGGIFGFFFGSDSSFFVFEKGTLTGEEWLWRVGFMQIGIFSIVGGLTLYGKVMRAVTKEKVRIEQDIAIAGSVQQTVLPERNEVSDRFSLHGQTIPAKEVGGDFFDVINITSKAPSGVPNRLLLAIGDVAGHGIAAGILSAMLKATLNASMELGHGVDESLQLLNRTIRKNAKKGWFVSFQIAVCDFDEKTLKLFNAGHLPILRCTKNGNVEKFHSAGMALGLSPKTPVGTLHLPIQRGDTFVFLTDGIIEAMNKDNEEFGIERVKECLQKQCSHLTTPQQLAHILYDDVKKFSDTESFSDDTTLLIIRIQ